MKYKWLIPIFGLAANKKLDHFIINKRHFFFPVSLTVILLVLALNLRAQQPVFKNYTTKDGLPSSEVYDVMQDSKGYMWFCTDAGVSRYDGYSFHNYSMEDGLSDNTIFGCYEDRKGRIWFRTLSGKLSYFFKDIIYTIGANERISSEMHNGIISSLYIDEGDTIWCGVVIGKGYFKITPPYNNPGLKYVQITEPGSYLFRIDSNGFIFGSVIAYPVHRNPEKRSILNELDKHGLNKKHVFAQRFIPNSTVFKTKKKDFLVTTLNAIFRLSNPGERYSHGGNSFIITYEDRNNAVWAGEFKGGLYCFPGGAFNQNIRFPHYLHRLSVSGIEEDREGGFWFTTLEQGVFYMSSHNILYYNKSTGLSDDRVLTIIAKDSESVWAGMPDHMISSVSFDTIINFKAKNPPPRINNIYRLYRNSVTQNILVGAVNSYVFRAEKNYMAEYICDQGDSIALKCFSNDTKGNLWAGNYLNLFKIDPVKNSVLEKYVSKSRIISLCCDAEDNVWIGSVNGLWLFKDRNFQYYGDKSPLFKNRIEDIKVSTDSTWYFATKGNGVIFKKGDSILTITQKNGLSSNICKTIYPDREGAIWVGTNNGINRIRMKKWGTYSIDVYSSDDGLLSNEINEMARTGNYLWASTNSGIIVFDINKAFSNTTAPPVYIASLEINTINKAVSDTFHLRHFENFLKINFIGLSYKRNSKLQYKYKLEGLDTAWNYTRETSIQFTTLPPGRYTFKVYAINNDGIISKNPAQFYFIISKPFWKEWWFVFLIVASVTSIILLAFRYRLQLLKKVALDKEEINRKIVESELKALRAQMNPHFIFNAINSIQNFNLKNDSDSAHKYLAKFSTLIRNVLENSKYEYIPLAEELQTLELYIELEQLRFSSKFNYTFSIGDDVSAENVLISPLIIQPYVENAIWHGLMHLKDGQGELKITVKKQEGLLKCIIDDNGIGREASLKLKQKSSHRSSGLSISKERIVTINKLQNSNMSVNITDKTDESGSAIGTRVEIFVPFNLIN